MNKLRWKRLKIRLLRRICKIICWKTIFRNFSRENIFPMYIPKMLKNKHFAEHFKQCPFKTIWFQLRENIFPLQYIMKRTMMFLILLKSNIVCYIVTTREYICHHVFLFYKVWVKFLLENKFEIQKDVV